MKARTLYLASLVYGSLPMLHAHNNGICQALASQRQSSSLVDLDEYNEPTPSDRCLLGKQLICNGFGKVGHAFCVGD
jgi:hypothetical protein